MLGKDVRLSQGLDSVAKLAAVLTGKPEAKNKKVGAGSSATAKTSCLGTLSGVRISSEGKSVPDDVIQLRQVYVYDMDGKNVALASNGGSAVQSSTHAKGTDADLVINGSLERCNHTAHQKNGAGGWLEVKLARPTAVSKVVIRNTKLVWQDRPSALRLAGSSIELLDRDGQPFKKEIFDVAKHPKLFEHETDPIWEWVAAAPVLVEAADALADRGVYKIKAVKHSRPHASNGRYLTAHGSIEEDKRNKDSTYAAVHDPVNDCEGEWQLERVRPFVYKIKSVKHGQQGRYLAAHGSIEDKRNHNSTYVMVVDPSNDWEGEWQFEPVRPSVYEIKSVKHGQEGRYLSAHGSKRADDSYWVEVHEPRNDWVGEWELEPIEDLSAQAQTAVCASAHACAHLRTRLRGNPRRPRVQSRSRAEARR